MDKLSTTASATERLNLDSHKENAAPAIARYPNLPGLPPLPDGNDDGHPPQLADCPSTAKAPLSPNTPANIGRRRQIASKLLALTSTPPRQSHMQRTSDIFTVAASSPSPARSPYSKHALPLFGFPVLDDSAWLKEHLQPGTQCDINRLDAERGLKVDLECHGHGSLTASAQSPSTRAAMSATPVRSPLRRADSAETDDSSSDEWTGDEDFLPRSSRRRHRHQRLVAKQLQHHHGALWTTPSASARLAASPIVDGPLTPAFQERLNALRSPTGSRFQRSETRIRRPLETATADREFCALPLIAELSTAQSTSEPVCEPADTPHYTDVERSSSGSSGRLAKASLPHFINR